MIGPEELKLDVRGNPVLEASSLGTGFFFLAVAISLAMALVSAIGLFVRSEAASTDIFVPVLFLSVGVLFFGLAESSIAITT